MVCSTNNERSSARLALDMLRCLQNKWQRSGAQSFWTTVNALQKQAERARSNLAPYRPTTPVFLLLLFAHQPR